MNTAVGRVATSQWPRSLLIGFGAHTLVWLGILHERLAAGTVTCTEATCYGLIVVDLPVSFLYIAGGADDVTYGSLVLGGAFWSLLVFGLSKVFQPRER
jgi:hypothetical protein